MDADAVERVCVPTPRACVETPAAAADRGRSGARAAISRCASGRSTPTSRASATTARRSRRCSRWPSRPACARRCRRCSMASKVNVTEGRAALHTALRGDLSPTPVARDAHAQALRGARAHARRWSTRWRRCDVTDIVSVGIGGSDLGPRLVVDALRGAGAGPFPRAFPVQRRRQRRAARAGRPRPARTAAILISKTFGTQETLLNGAHPARLARRQRAPVRGQRQRRSAPRRSASRRERILPMWDWVGGRYSLWSAVGFPDRAGDRHGRVSKRCSPAPRKWMRTCWTRRAATQPRGLACADRGLEPQRARLRHAGRAALRRAPRSCCRTTCSSW